jgi:hypothetical protein
MRVGNAIVSLDVVDESVVRGMSRYFLPLQLLIPGFFSFSLSISGWMFVKAGLGG